MSQSGNRLLINRREALAVFGNGRNRRRSGAAGSGNGQHQNCRPPGARKLLNARARQ